MNNLFSLSTPLESIFLPKTNTLLKQFLLIIAGVLLLTFAAQLSVPLIPVPLTFQSATVVLIGMMFGARNGGYVVATYLIAGLCGLPVFEGFASGVGTFLGPTCGYLLGFLPAAIISGYLAQNGFAKNSLTSFIAACIGASVIFFFGVSFLATSIGMHDAIAFGLLPFIISEPVKLFMLSLLVPRCWNKK